MPTHDLLYSSAALRFLGDIEHERTDGWTDPAELGDRNSVHLFVAAG